MAFGGAAKCAKIMLIAVNIIFILSGLLLIAIGAWLIGDSTVWRIIGFVASQQSNLFRAAAGLLIAMGILVVLISAIGFAGAITEMGVLLGVYIGLVGLVFCGEIAAGIIAIVYQDKIINQATTSMTTSLQTALSPSSPYYSSEQTTNGTCKASDVGTSWDYVQVYFECCGAGSFLSSGYENANISLQSLCPSLHLPTNKPLTCCSQLDSNMDPIDSANQAASLAKFDCSKMNGNGCVDAMVAWIQKYAPVLIGIGIGIAMLQMVIVIFALCLCQHREKD